MNNNGFKHYMIMDLEATCCDDNSFPRTEMEIIEIGAVMVDADDLRLLDEFQIFIRPVRHPQLTEFCKKLTTITQQDVEEARVFSEAVKSFSSWLNNYSNVLFCSWGDYDRKQFAQDCQFHKIENPLSHEHLNIKKEFSKAFQSDKRFGLAQALNHVGLTLEGTHHRGIDDARNMFRLLPYILKRKAFNSSGL